MINKAQELAVAYVHTSEDRMRNFIQVGDTRIDLVPQPTLLKAKAQWADAHWVVQCLLQVQVDSV